MTFCSFSFYFIENGSECGVINDEIVCSGVLWRWKNDAFTSWERIFFFLNNAIFTWKYTIDFKFFKNKINEPSKLINL